MSLASTTARVAVTITGLPQTIPVFAFDLSTDLLVLDGGTTNTSIDPPTTLVLGSDYTVTGGGYNALNQLQTGNVVVNSGGVGNVQVGDVITILRGISPVQATTFSSTGLQTPLMIESDDDNLTAQVQQLADLIKLCLTFEKNETLSPILVRSQRAGFLLGFDANGNISYVSVPGGIVGTVASLTGTQNQILVSGSYGSPQTGALTLTFPTGGITVGGWVISNTPYIQAPSGAQIQDNAGAIALFANNAGKGITLTAQASGVITLKVASTVVAQFTAAGAAILGTTTNNNASAGNIGEIITNVQSTSSPIALSSGMVSDLTTVSLTAGDWDVDGIAWILPSGTNVTDFQISTNTASVTQPTIDSGARCVYTAPTAFRYVYPIPHVRYSLSTTTTIYLSASADFGSGSAGSGGFLRARRVR